MKARTKARGIALQVLFEYDMAGHAPLLSLSHRLEEDPIDEKLVEFTTKIVTGILPIIEKLDELIAVHAPEWPMDQLAIIDRNILRIALWEFAIEQCTPVKVAINEAIELAKVYGSDATPRFVNGVLGSLANKQNVIVQNVKSSL